LLFKSTSKVLVLKFTQFGFTPARIKVSIMEIVGDEAPLWKAVCNNDTIGMMDLLRDGANTEWSGGNILTDKTTALQMAVRMGRLSMVRSLLKYKANIHVRTHDGGTLLHDAVTWLDAWNALLMVWILLKHGADVDAADYVGSTALHEAARKGNYWVVQDLIQKKADVMLQTRDGQTALEIVSAIDTSNLSEQRFRCITTTRENLKSEMDRLEQANQCLVAFAMGQHKRLGQFSKVLALHPELVRMMLT
jgi:hypothetical protein